MKVIFLVPYPIHVAPSQRFRFEQYFELLQSHGIEFEIQSFIHQKTWKILYQPGNHFFKIFGILGGLIRRLKIMARIRQFDWVFIHREAAPIGPPVFEWVISRLLKKRIIFDFDDAIWLPNTSKANSVASLFKSHHKISRICRWSYKISAGNQYLADYARKYNSRIVVNPSTIETDHYHNQVKDQYTEETIIGWTGTHSTLKYLQMVMPVLQKLEAVYHFTFIVIADKKPDIKLKNYRFVRWNHKTEIDDLLRFNIGIMPLQDDAWSKGKCGFKALQYMSLGIPAIASPVGVNKQIIDQGENGFLCASEDEWYDKLRLLIKEPDLRYLMGQNGRKKILEHYSVKSNTGNFLSIFQKNEAAEKVSTASSTIII